MGLTGQHGRGRKEALGWLLGHCTKGMGRGMFCKWQVPVRAHGSGRQGKVGTQGKGGERPGRQGSGLLRRAGGEAPGRVSTLQLNHQAQLSLYLSPAAELPYTGVATPSPACCPCLAAMYILQPPPSLLASPCVGLGHLVQQRVTLFWPAWGRCRGCPPQGHTNLFLPLLGLTQLGRKVATYCTASLFTKRGRADV